MHKLILSNYSFQIIPYVVYLVVLVYGIWIYLFNNYEDKISLKNLTPIGLLEKILNNKDQNYVKIERFLEDIRYNNSSKYIEIDSKFAHRQKLNNVLKTLLFFQSDNSYWMRHSELIYILINLIWNCFIVFFLLGKIYPNIKFLTNSPQFLLSLLTLMLIIDINIRSQVINSSMKIIQKFYLVDSTEEQNVNKYFNRWKIKNLGHTITPVLSILNFFKKPSRK